MTTVLGRFFRFFLKYFLVLTIVTLCTFYGCNGEKHMKKIEAMWKNLITSKNETGERKVLEDINKYMTGKNIRIKVLALDPQGVEIDLNNVVTTRDVIIKVTFKEGDASFIAPDWLPQNPKNLFVLFRE
jgi:uncharacterized membrane protein